MGACSCMPQAHRGVLTARGHKVARHRRHAVNIPSVPLQLTDALGRGSVPHCRSVGIAWRSGKAPVREGCNAGAPARPARHSLPCAGLPHAEVLIVPTAYQLLSHCSQAARVAPVSELHDAVPNKALPRWVHLLRRKGLQYHMMDRAATAAAGGGHAGRRGPASVAAWAHLGPVPGGLGPIPPSSGPYPAPAY